MPNDKKKLYPCAKCGARIALDKAQCPSCLTWHSLVTGSNVDDGVVRLSDVIGQGVERYVTGPWDKCFGGGIARKSTTIIGGKSGAGKSTLSLQIVDGLCELTKRDALYVAVEEDIGQIQDRAIRLGLKNRHNILMLPMGQLQNMSRAIMSRKPCAVILDSLSKLVGNDLDEGTTVIDRAKEYAIELNSPFLFIDHITKEGELAGLEAWQHTADATLMFTVIDNIRVLETLKNRNGEAFVRVAFDMTSGGLIARPDEDVSQA